MLRNDLYAPWFNGDTWGIEILRDQFQGTVLQINKIEFSKTNDSAVDLDYQVIKRPEPVTENDMNSDIFNELMSVIVSDILTEAVKLHQDEQNRTNDTQESSQ